MMVLFDLLPLLLLGAALGVFGGVFGIGGGIIAIPIMVLCFAMPQPLAQGTALVMMVPNLLVACWRYNRKNPVAWRHALGIALTASLATWLSARFATRVSPMILRMIFSVFFIAMAVALIRRSKASNQPLPARIPVVWIPVVGLFGGACMGLIGIGGGLVATPLLTQLFGQRQTSAQSLALALVAPSSVMALLTYAHAGQVDWAMGLPLALGGVATVSFGVTLAHKLPERRMRKAFSWLLLLTAVWMLISPWLLGQH